MSGPRWPVDPFEISVRPGTYVSSGPGLDLTDAPDAKGSSHARSDLGILARGSALGLVAGAGSSLFAFALVVVVSRGLHPARRAGVLFEAMALFLILSNVAELGADTGLVRMVARYRALGRPEDVRRTIALALWPVLIVSVLFSGVVFALAPQLARIFIRAGSRSDGTSYIRMFAPFVPLATATIVALSGTRGFGTMAPYTAIQGLGVPVLRPLAMLSVLAAGMGTVWIALAYTMPVAIGFVIAVVALFVLLSRDERRTNAGSRSPRPWRDLGREFWAFSAPRGLAAMFQVAVFQLDILLVGALRTAKEAGIYAAASRYPGVGTVALQGLALAIAPQISAFLARGERDRARRVFQSGTWWLVIVAWPALMAMIVFAPLLMRVFGHEFVECKTALVILSLAMLAVVGTGNNKIVLLMGGGSTWNMLVTGSSFTVNIVMNLLLIPRFGMNGAAVAFATSIVYDNAFTAFLVWRLLHLHPFGRGYWLAIAGGTICWGGVGLLVRHWMGMSVIAFLVFGGLATVLYAAFLWRARRMLNLTVLRDVLRRRPEPVPIEVGSE